MNTYNKNAKLKLVLEKSTSKKDKTPAHEQYEINIKTQMRSGSQFYITLNREAKQSPLTNYSLAAPRAQKLIIAYGFIDIFILFLRCY